MACIFFSLTFILLGGDLTQTRDSLQTFLTAIQEYQQKVTLWRDQAADIAESAPTWIDQASIALTIFLLWFGLSQFGILLHGLNTLRGADPLFGLRRTKVVVHKDGVMNQPDGDRI